MSVPVIFNPLATDSTKIIRPISDFIVLRRDRAGQPVLLLSADLKQVFKFKDGVAIPISDKSVPANTIITFDAANQNITNGSLVPPENKLTAYNDNAVRTQILSNNGHIITAVATQYGFFANSDDLLVVGNGSTWKMSWDMDFATTNAGTSFQVPYILQTNLTVGGGGGFRSEALLIMNMEVDGTTVKFYYKNTSDTFIAFHTGASVYTPEGTRVKCSIARSDTTFDFVFDANGVISTQAASINIALVKSHTKNLFGFGDFTNVSYWGTFNIDNLTYPNAS